MIRFDLGQDHRDRLGILVLEIGREHGVLNVGQLLPHVPAGRTADLFHDPLDLVGVQELGQKAFGRVIVAHQGAGRGHLAGKIDQQLPRPGPP